MCAGTHVCDGEEQQQQMHSGKVYLYYTYTCAVLIQVPHVWVQHFLQLVCFDYIYTMVKQQCGYLNVCVYYSTYMYVLDSHGVLYCTRYPMITINYFYFLHVGGDPSPDIFRTHYR